MMPHLCRIGSSLFPLRHRLPDTSCPPFPTLPAGAAASAAPVASTMSFIP